MIPSAISSVLHIRSGRIAAGILPLLLLIGSGSASLGADQATNDRTSSLVVLAVGEPPVTRLVSAGSDAEGNPLTQEAEVDPARLPPAMLLLGDDSAEKAAARQIPVFLNEFSRKRHFPARDGIRVYGAPGDASELIRVPGGGESGEHLLVLFPDPKIRTWKNMRSLALPNDWSGFPSDAIRIINVCDSTALFEAGGKKWRIGPGQTEVIRHAGGENTVPYRLYIQTKEGGEILRRAAIRTGGGRRQTLVVYPTDPATSRRTAATAHFIETRIPADGELTQGIAVN